MTGSSEANTVREIDTTFDFRTDAGGKDPDSRPTLRRYRQILWSKPLPGVELGRLGASKGC